MIDAVSSPGLGTAAAYMIMTYWAQHTADDTCQQGSRPLQGGTTAACGCCVASIIRAVISFCKPQYIKACELVTCCPWRPTCSDCHIPTSAQPAPVPLFLQSKAVGGFLQQCISSLGPSRRQDERGRQRGYLTLLILMTRVRAHQDGGMKKGY